MTTRFKNMYEKAKENLISPSMIYVYDNVCYAIDNEHVEKLTDEEIEKVCEYIDNCLGYSDYISTYNLARYFMICINNGVELVEALNETLSVSPYDFVNNAIEYFA